MASHLHETLVEMFRHRPGLAAELVSGLLGVAVPEQDHARLGAGEVAELRPAEHRADAVVVLDAWSGPVWAVVVEVQLRPDEDKRWVWPEYVVGVRRRPSPSPWAGPAWPSFPWCSARTGSRCSPTPQLPPEARSWLCSRPWPTWAPTAPSRCSTPWPAPSMGSPPPRLWSNACTDFDQLDAWGVRSLTARSVEDLFA